MTEFPLWNIGTVNGIDYEFDVHWVEQDLAELTVDGELQMSFCSENAGGFIDEADVIAQAEDVVAEMDAVALDALSEMDIEW